MEISKTKLILTREEAKDLRDATETALRYGKSDSIVYCEIEMRRK